MNRDVEGRGNGDNTPFRFRLSWNENVLSLSKYIGLVRFLIQESRTRVKPPGVGQWKLCIPIRENLPQDIGLLESVDFGPGLWTL